MNCKDGFEEEFYRAWDAGQVKRVADGKTMGPQRPWVGLTEEEITQLDMDTSGTVHDFVQAVDSKLKEKNKP